MPDLITAAVVVLIFEVYRDGFGLRAIAQLTDQGMPSPSEHDPHRNPHRWVHATVRAILANPAYRGVGVWGKQERFESLIDPTDVAAGYVTRMRWRDPETWVVPEKRTHDPIVDDELFEAVQRRLHGGRRPRITRRAQAQRAYPLSGRLYCGLCGFKMEAQHRASRSGDGPGWNRYRCRPGTHRSISTDIGGHPKNVYVREDAILEHLDEWIASFTNAEWLAAGQQAVGGENPAVAALHQRIKDLDRKIENLVVAIENAPESAAILAKKLAQRTSERDEAAAKLKRVTTTAELTVADITALIDQLGGIVKALKHATADERAEIYEALALKLTYEPEPRLVRVEVDQARGVWMCPRGDLNPHPLDGD